MKSRIIALALFTLFRAVVSPTQAESFSSGPSTAGRETILPAPVESASFERGRFPFYGGESTSPSLETTNTPSGVLRTSSANGITDLIGLDFARMPLTAYVPTASPPTISAPAAVESCAPILYCLWAGCWYELIDNAHFDEPSSCSPNWIFPAGYVTPSSSICSGPGVTTFSKVAVLPYASGFNQSFFVPFEDGTLGASLIFATVGSPTFNDRIVVEVLEGSLVRRRVSIRTDLGPFDCHREDYTLLGDYKGKNLKLRVRSQIVTPGVEFHIDSVTLFYSL